MCERVGVYGKERKALYDRTQEKDMGVLKLVMRVRKVGDKKLTK